MNNKMLGKCEWCGQDYCQECTDFEVKVWQKFCSTLCEKEYNEDERIKNKRV